MKQLHRISGIVIIIFVGLHLSNHAVSVMGGSAHLAVMNALRTVYRNPVVESILLFAVLVQIISGLKILRVKTPGATWFEKLQSLSGIYLAMFFLFHIGAVFAGRFILDLDTNFYFGVAGLNTFPFNLFFGPYYGLAILAFFGHLASIHNKKMKRNLLGLKPKIQSVAILVLGFVAIVVIFYGLTNQFQGVIIPREYEVLIGN